MKQIKFLGTAIMATLLLLLTSCLGDSGTNEHQLSLVPGQIQYKDGKVLVNTGADLFYSPQIGMEYMPGDWVSISFKVDFDSDENKNAAANGYYVIQLLVAPSIINQAPVYQDTMGLDKALTAEIPLTNAVIGTNYYYLFTYSLGHMLVTSTYKGLTDQKNDFMMILDPNQEAEQESGINVYNVYIRAVKRDEGKSPQKDTEASNIYNVERALDAIVAKERSNGKETYSLKFNYVKEIDEETGAVTWASNEEIVKFAVPKETN